MGKLNITVILAAKILFNCQLASAQVQQAYSPSLSHCNVPPPVSFFSGPPKTQQEFVDRYLHLALNVQRETGLSAAGILAMGMLESASGASYLATTGRNFFGYTCDYLSLKGDWKPIEESFTGRSGREIRVEAKCNIPREEPPPRVNFYSFQKPEDSFWALAQFLMHNKRAAKLTSLRAQLAATTPPNILPAEKMISAIRGYAQHGAKDSEYQRDVNALLLKLNLKRFDACPSAVRTVEKPSSQTVVAELPNAAT